MSFVLRLKGRSFFCLLVLEEKIKLDLRKIKRMVTIYGWSGREVTKMAAGEKTYGGKPSFCRIQYGILTKAADGQDGSLNDAELRSDPERKRLREVDFPCM